MLFRKLGKSGLGVSPISLGTMGFGPPLEHKEATKLVGYARDLGINMIDTANCYDGPNRKDGAIQGYAEQYLGKIFKENNWREDFILLTKAGVPLGENPQSCGLSPTHLLRELDKSLLRLELDYVDIFMLHHRDSYADPAVVLEALDVARQQGKARAFGISNHPAWEVCEYLWQADKGKGPTLSVCEVPLNPLNRQYEHHMPFYQRHDVGVAVSQPLQGGLLGRSYLREQPNSADDKQVPGWKYTPDEATLEQITQLNELAENHDLSLSEMSFQWSLAQPAVATLTVGARSQEQLKSSVDAASKSLPDGLLEQINAITPSTTPPLVRFKRD